MPITQIKKVSEFARKEREKFNKKKSLPKKIFWILLRVGIIGFVLGVITFLFLLVWFSKDLPNPEKLMDRDIAQSSKILDNKEETVLYEIYGDQKRTLVKLESIPQYVQWATITAEDRYFYEHKGFNIFAIIKGTILDPLRGRRARGGSTLTQQFVKNSILTNERSIARKVKELILAYRLEQKFTKDEILQLYLNEIPYGSLAYGIGSASQTFFGKEVQDLTLAESAFLASLPNAPTYYSPYGSNLEKTYERQQWILDGMVEEGYINEEDAQRAKNEELHFQVKRESIIAPHFVMYVKEQLSEMFGEKMVEQGGLKIVTTLDLEKQDIAQTAVVNGVDSRSQQYGFSNAALVALDPKTGQILAMVGSKDYFDAEIDGNVNVTTRLRQPGSSIKPLIYAAAFDKGYTPDTILFDVSTRFKTGVADYVPNNYDLKEHGPVTIRNALQWSLNITAVKAMYLVGVDNVLNFLETMGYSSFEDRSRFGLAVVLGGGEVQLLEHVAAYSVFATDGMYHEPVAILRVEDAQGNILYENEPKERRALDENIARMMNNVLSDNGARTAVFGASSYMNIGRPAGAKTGTTNDYHDAWTVGYTPQLVAGVWAGNNDNTEMARGAGGSTLAAPIWNEFMTKALKDEPVVSFTPYQKWSSDKPILNGVYAVERKVTIDKFSGKLATEYTPESAKEERTYKTVHNILYYLNKDNPTGEVPTNPANDPQYKSWEAGVQAWVLKKQSSTDPKDHEDYSFFNETAPTEYDDVHKPEFTPSISLKSPQDNQTITTSSITASVLASAPRGVYRVDYYIDNQLIGTNYNYPYSLEYKLSSSIINGYHKFKAIVYDDVENQSQVEVDINILAENREQAQATFIYPDKNSHFTTSQLPLITTATINDLLSIKKVNFYYQKGSDNKVMYGSVIAPSESNIAMELPTAVGSGNITLSVEVEIENMKKSITDTIGISID